MGGNFFTLTLRARRKLSKYFVILLVLLIFTYLFLYTIVTGPSPKTKVTEPDPEMKDILHATPYLWRKAGSSTMASDFPSGDNETVGGRIKAQIEWIRQISSTNYVRKATPKTILVKNGLDLYYATNGRINCPYAPEFETKCKLIESKFGFMENFFGAFDYLGLNADAEVTVRNWDHRRHTYKIPDRIQQIMYILEPPEIAKAADLGMNNAILASYWKGSDIPIPYRQWVPGPEPADFAAHNERIRNELKNATRSKQVAAIISNCDSTTRLKYIEELQEYISVDVYGRCGTLSCPRSKNTDCLLKIAKEYKFFLSFENSNCESYITEKLFENALQYKLLPVVMGAPPDNYISAAPPNSFIHVDNFQSPQKLAEYLNFLEHNDEEYEAYFKWWGTGYINSGALEDFFCRVCGMLFYRDFVEPPKWSSSDVKWKDVNLCLPQSQWSWSTSNGVVN